MGLRQLSRPTRERAEGHARGSPDHDRGAGNIERRDHGLERRDHVDERGVSVGESNHAPPQAPERTDRRADAEG